MARGNKTPKRNVRSLPIELWPKADREAWESACQPARRLKRGGSAAHLKPITRNDLARRYGYFLDFLGRRGLLRINAIAAADVTPDNIESYITELKARVGSVTVYGSIYKLRRTAQLIASDRDFSWLADIEKDLAFVVRPRSKFDRVVMADRLLEAGLTLIHEAKIARNMSGVARARQARNGLMVALLALCPIRPKNFAALEIGRSFVEVKGKWWIVLGADETKEGRHDERPVDAVLNSAIAHYLAEVRPALAANRNLPSDLWLSSHDGTAMTYDGVARAIKTTTLATVGVDVSPHLFRTSGATTAATLGRRNPYLASALLHHTNAKVTNASYNRASCVGAAERLRQTIRRGEGHRRPSPEH